MKTDTAAASAETFIAAPLICERDDGQFQIGIGDAAARPFPTRAFAESVAVAVSMSAVSS